jgi:hypothetical protein
MELYRRLRTLGIRLSIDPAGRLAFDAPSGAMTSQLREDIRAHRIELLGLLESISERAAILEHDSGMSREDAERIALEGLMAIARPSPTSSAASTTSAPMDPRDEEMPDGVICPHCGSRQLVDDPGGMRCKPCGRLAWILDGPSIVRADYAKTDLRI